MSLTPERWQQVKSLFDQALDLPPHERHPWIAGRTEADPALREEVLSLLAAHEAAPDRFESGPAVSIG